MARPNIVLINCDDLGYGDLGCYGSKVNKTPTLDRLAAEGARFTDFYMASPVCSPSRGAMMTGCYPPRIGFGLFEGRWVLYPGQAVGLNPQEETIASLLSKNGYATKLIGKWHCGDQPEFMPTSHGFDSYYGIPFSNDMGVQLGREGRFPPLPLVRDDQVIQEQPSQTSLTERYVEECTRFIRENKERPFFLYLAHMYVHRPIFAPQRFLKQSENGKYGAAVECVDWATSVIMYELEKAGIDENTLVIFTSDNGSRGRDEGGSNLPLRGGKGSTWEGGQRVPCIMRWPKKIPAGIESSEIISSIDFYRTFAALAGAGVPEDRVIDSLDVSSIMFEDGAESPRKTFYYHHMDNLEAVRHGDWKLHVRKGEDIVQELYNLKQDIGEATNVYDKNPDVVAELTRLADLARQDLGDRLSGIEKSDSCRPIGHVDNPKALTEYDPDHPYIEALYDTEDGG